MTPPRNRDSLLAVLMKDKLDERFPHLTSRLAVEDIILPNLRRTLRYGKLMEQDTMIRRHGLSWNDFPQAFPGGKPVQAKSYPKLPFHEPEGGFIHTEKLEIAALEKQNDFHIPLPLQEDFHDVTGLEAHFAFGWYKAIGARLVDARDGDLQAWVKKSAQQLGIQPPRLVIAESDSPNCGVMSLPRMPATVFITANMVEILNGRQLKAVIGHEMDHIRKRYDADMKRYRHEKMPPQVRRNLMSLLRNAPDSAIVPSSSGPYDKEYQADEQGARLTSTEDMMDALAAVDSRVAELGRCSEQLQQVLKEEKIDKKELPLSMRLLTGFKGRKIPQEGQRRESYKGDKTDDHPPTLWRIEHLGETAGVRSR